MACALLASVFVALAQARGLPVQRPALSSGGAWLVSPAQGVVTLVDGPSEEVVGLLRVPGLTAADQVSAVQDGEDGTTRADHPQLSERDHVRIASRVRRHRRDRATVVAGR